ncbi:uncharacterized protein LOC115213251 [Octopus sinensis]|uniref:Uncharacterized protein LOC115213251 n=1 Tax=Octopus sinensis TaxID=2607531 RepID=A0A6P7SIK5_9MOLL|nr:uncharacterized protein LOC115213251 [Octopus sinensis]
MVTVHNRFAELSTNRDTVTEQYGKIVQSNEEVAAKLIPIKKRMKQRKLADDPRLEKACSELEVAFSNYQKTANNDTKQTFQRKKEDLKQVYQEKLDEMISQVENADTKCKHRESWRLINSIKQGIIKGKSKDEGIKKWSTHFYELLGKELEVDSETENEELAKILDGLQIEDGDFTKQEIERATSNLKEGKQTGPDNIPPEVLKICDLDNIILEFANKLLNDNVKPEQWSKIDSLPLPKTGDLSDTGNYRGISLSTIVAKMDNKMILN